MKDYTYQDMLKMQEEAANRVREMKRRAAIITEEEPNYNRAIPDKVKCISMPVEAENAIYEPNNHEATTNSSILSTLFKDNDAVLIMSIVALLSLEGCNMDILLPLVYILL